MGDPKHPYKLKLDKKADLLGMGRGKHWVLLANTYDETLLRNWLTSYLGSRLGLDYTPRMEPVDLYVNDEYVGGYVLAPQIRVDGISVAIDERTEEGLSQHPTERPQATHPYETSRETSPARFASGSHLFS